MSIFSLADFDLEMFNKHLTIYNVHININGFRAFIGLRSNNIKISLMIDLKKDYIMLISGKNIFLLKYLRHDIHVCMYINTGVHVWQVSKWMEYNKLMCYICNNYKTL